MTEPLLPLEDFIRYRCKSNKSKAARVLGVSRMTLDRWLKRESTPSPMARMNAKTKGCLL